MLPYAFNQLRQAAINYQLQGGPNGAPGPGMTLNIDPRGGLGGAPMNPYAGPLNPYAALDPLLGYRFGPHGPRFIHEEPKPQHSYIGLIAMAILSNPDKKMVLSDIYQWILDNYPYFRSRGPGWRNSIRHNLSLNDCFIKSGRSANGKGHYWAIHPANTEDFKRGDFRRRRAQRKVRKHMGLSVPDEEDDSDDSPTHSPVPGQTIPVNGTIQGPPTLVPPGLPNLFQPIPESNGDTPKPMVTGGSPGSMRVNGSADYLSTPQSDEMRRSSDTSQVSPMTGSERSSTSSSDASPPNSLPPKKRNFDMASLLAPDVEPKKIAMKHELLDNANLRATQNLLGISSAGGMPGSAAAMTQAAAAAFLQQTMAGHSLSPTKFAGLSSNAFWPFGLNFPSSNGLPGNWAQPPTSVPSQGPMGNGMSLPPTSCGGNQVSALNGIGLQKNGNSGMNDNNRNSPQSGGDSNKEDRTPSPNTAAQWNETFAKIMARSYQGRQASANHQRLSQVNIKAEIKSTEPVSP